MATVLLVSPFSSSCSTSSPCPFLRAVVDLDVVGPHFSSISPSSSGCSRPFPDSCASFLSSVRRLVVLPARSRSFLPRPRTQVVGEGIRCLPSWLPGPRHLLPNLRLLHELLHKVRNFHCRVHSCKFSLVLSRLVTNHIMSPDSLTVSLHGASLVVFEPTSSSRPATVLWWVLRLPLAWPPLP